MGVIKKQCGQGGHRLHHWTAEPEKMTILTIVEYNYVIFLINVFALFFHFTNNRYMTYTGLHKNSVSNRRHSTFSTKVKSKLHIEYRVRHLTLPILKVG
jgi:hypothetical protein